MLLTETAIAKRNKQLCRWKLNSDVTACTGSSKIRTIVLILWRQMLYVCTSHKVAHNLPMYLIAKPKQSVRCLRRSHQQTSSTLHGRRVLLDSSALSIVAKDQLTIGYAHRQHAFWIIRSAPLFPFHAARSRSFASLRSRL